MGLSSTIWQSTHRPAAISGWDNPAEWVSPAGTQRDRLLALLSRAQSFAASHRYGADLLLLFAEAAEEARATLNAGQHAEAQDWAAVAELAWKFAAELRPSRPGAGA